MRDPSLLDEADLRLSIATIIKAALEHIHTQTIKLNQEIMITKQKIEKYENKA